MHMKHTRLVLTFLALLSLSGFAQAYIGPGAGITFIGALIGLVVAVFSAIGFIIMWPIRKAMKKMKARRVSKDETEETSAESSIEKSDLEDETAQENPVTE